MGNTCSKYLEEGEREQLQGEVKKERDKRIWAEKKFNLAYMENQDLREMVASLKRRVAEVEGEKRGGGQEVKHLVIFLCNICRQ
jgi:hypothetical protein